MIRILTFLASFALAAQFLNSAENPVYLFEYSPNCGAPGIISAEGPYLEENKCALCGHAHANKNRFNSTQEDETGPNSIRPYDVLSYHLYMDWREIFTRELDITVTENSDTLRALDDEFGGVNKIRMELTEDGIESIELDAYGLGIEYIKLNGADIDPAPQPDDSLGFLNIPIGPGHSKGDVLEFEIAYSHLYSEIENPENQRGFYALPEGMEVLNRWQVTYYDEDTNEVKIRPRVDERVAYTFCEPNGARTWMPCNDNPHDKAMVEISVSTPDFITVASNGLLYGVEKIQGGRTYHWKHKYQIPTYLMHIAASKYARYSEIYTSVLDGDETEIEYYFWEQDYGLLDHRFAPYNAWYQFRDHIEMMGVYESAFGKYPFEKYGISTVILPFAGAMEHQTITTVDRSWLVPSNSYGYAHELAHHWIGDKISCGTWKDIWINEGGATWGEAIWAGRVSEKNYYNHMQKKRTGYMYRWNNQEKKYVHVAFTHPPIYGIELERLFYNPTTYNKASWVYHMLSEMLGKDEFYSALQGLMSQYAYKSLTTNEFKEYLIANIENPPVPFEDFFQQWLMSKGHPQYIINTYSEDIGDGNYEAATTLNQAQVELGMPYFKAPVTLLYYKDSLLAAERDFINLEAGETFKAILDFRPDYVLVDTTVLLAENVSTVTAVKEIGEIVEESAVFPNPLTKDEGYLRLSVKKPEFIEIELLDSYGSNTEGIYSGYLPAGNYEFAISSKGLSSGVYFVSINTGAGRETIKLNITK